MYRILRVLVLPASIVSAVSLVAAAQDTAAAPQPQEVNVKDLAKTVSLAEDALLLHTDRTSHLDEALGSFLENYETAKKNTSTKDTPKSSSKEQEKALMKELEELLRIANVRQLDQLIESLKDVMEEELKRRNNAPVTTTTVADEEPAKSKPKKFPVSATYLGGMFDIESVLGKSESALEQWIDELIQQEVGNLVNETVSEIVEELTSTPTNNEIELELEQAEDIQADASQNCVSTATAAQEVQTALLSYSQDGIGRQDHAQGGVIVHEMTSPSFVPGAREKEHLGAWSRYIPEELEELLPDGWMDWELPRVPGTYGSASPRAILHADTTPGSCWPLQGQSGFVTFRLPYPVKVSAVSFDHASELLLTSGLDQKASAPKQVKVYGYPPCDTDGGCGGLGLDASDKFLLTEITYEIEGPSTQTFTLGTENVGEPEDELEPEAGSCSATTATCGGPPDTTVAAVRVEVESNWGNEAFTCLYRVRVHGDRVG